MIKLTEKIGYGFGDMASSMFWKLFGAYLMIFYKRLVMDSAIWHLLCFGSCLEPI